VAQGSPALTQTLYIDAEGITVSYPEGWSVAPKRFTNTHELINVPADQQDTVEATARIKIRIQTRTDHAEAVHELQEIATEVDSPSTFLAIGGWPALQRRHLERRQQPSQGLRFTDEMVLRITTAVVAGNLLIRFDGTLPSDADQELIDQVEAIGRSLVFTTTGDPGQVDQEIENLRSSTSLRSSFSIPLPREGGSSARSALAATPSADAKASSEGIFDRLLHLVQSFVSSSGYRGASSPVSSAQASSEELPGLGFTQRLFTGNNGELEIAASPDGHNIVIARQNNFRTSNDGGQTFPFSGNLNLGDGDSSLAFAQSGNFYLAGIRTNCQPADVAGPFGYTCTGVFRSTNNGQTFGSLTNAVVCPNGDPAGVVVVANRCFPDQEHIAADRVNPGTGGDQVYSTWRNFDATDQDPAIVCSQDSGANWTLPVDVDSGFIPRIGVGQDGFVYVVYRSGGNIRINKYSSCRNGLTVQPTFPKTIAAVNDVTCPVPGLDRCNDGNNLSSIMVAVDDTNPNHIYVAYAHETGAGNQNILVHDSLDGGVTWPAARVVTLNTAVSGVRFMPWVCTTGGEAFVTWYDRRSATPCPAPPCAANNDLTDYFFGRARLDSLNNLVAGAESKLTDAADPQCAAGATPGSAASWGCFTRATGDSESCSFQPQLAGRCCDNTMPNCPGSQQRCDFSDGGCPAGETCNGGGGCPKYGDYNGNACVAGRLLAAWASATPPLGITPSGGIDVFFSSNFVRTCGDTTGPGSTDVICSCGDTVTTNTKLTGADPVSSSGPGDFCSGDGLSVASGVTLDCDSAGLRGDGSGDGVKIDSVSGVTVKNCNILEFDNGIGIYFSSDITLRSDKAKFNSDGVDANDSSDLTITGSFMQDNSNDGVNLDHVSSSTVQNSRLERNGDDGFQCDDGCTFVTVQNNQVNSNTSDGIEFEESGNSNNFILNNVAKNNCAGGGCSSDEGSGIVLEGDVTFTEVSGNQVNGNRRGIFLEIESGSPNNNIVSNNNAEKNLQEGILIESDNNTVSDNQGQKNGSNGLAVTGTSNSLSGNVFNFNAGHGICTSAGNSDGGGNTGNGNGVLPDVNINGGC